MINELWENAINEEELYLEHYGVKYRSGRYAYGSGEDPYQHDPKGFYSRYRQLKDEGLSEKELCYEFGTKVKRKDGSIDIIPLSSGQLRARISAAREQERLERNDQILKYKAHGYSNREIARKLGINESVVRSTIEADKAGRIGEATHTADMLKKNVDAKGVIDIGAGVNIECGVGETKWETAIQMLKDEGYEVHNIKVEQATNAGKETTVRVLAKPGTKWEEIYYNLDSIQTINEYSPDGGGEFRELVRPKSIDSSRVFVRYAEDGGAERDGTIELRPGVPDLDMGGSAYSQVRIGVDDKLYCKGMAFYNDNIPEGYDIVVNSNKHRGAALDEVLKKYKDDPTNPFGALIKAGGQTYYIDENGKEQLGVVNKLKEEGEWEDYSKNLASQFLGKQDKKLIKQQLDLTLQGRRNEFDDILTNVDNDAIKQSLLYSFADDCESAAVHLKAAPLPGQSTKVLLPVPGLKDNECYCPSMPDGEELYLVRFPHAGTFEIPKLTNNLRNKDGKAIVGSTSQDVIGINSNAASVLSGADFDGDTAVVIPSRGGKTEIKTSVLDDLKGFDPKELYPYEPGQKEPWKKGSEMEQKQMGMVSNLITDMYAQGADTEEIARATKHSMVVIDTGKHKLNYAKSEKDNRIQELKDKYQNGGGASTLLSRAKGQKLIDEVSYDKINKETGEKEHVYTNREYMKREKVKLKDERGRYVKDENGNYIYAKDENGKPIFRDVKKVVAQQKSTQMAEVRDAYELSSGSEIEGLYANFANGLKSLALQARKEALAIKPYPVDKDTKKLYSAEVASINDKIKNAMTNAPRERYAQIKAADAVNKFKKEYRDRGEDYIKGDKDKLANRTLQEARIAAGAKMSGEKGRSIKLTDNEWRAINEGAVSSNVVKKMLNYTSDEEIRKFAMPKKENYISPGKKQMMKSMANNGYTLSEIADTLGVSTSTVSNYI